MSEMENRNNDIFRQLFTSAGDTLLSKISESYVEVREAEIREKLMALGWTPPNVRTSNTPDEVERLQTRIDELEGALRWLDVELYTYRFPLHNEMRRRIAEALTQKEKEDA